MDLIQALLLLEKRSPIILTRQELYNIIVLFIRHDGRANSKVIFSFHDISDL